MAQRGLSGGVATVPARARARAAWALCLCCALGCGNKQGGTAVAGAVGTGPSHQKPRQADEDAGSPAPALDAGMFDHTIASGGGLLCGYDDADMLMLAGSSTLPELASATDERGFALLFHDAAGALFIEAVPVGGAAHDPVEIVAPSDAAAGIALAVSGQHFLLGWRDQDATAQTLHARELSSAGTPTRVLSSALVPSTQGGELCALLGLDDGFIAGWLEQSGSSQQLRLQRLDADGAPAGAAVTVPGVGALAPQDVHLARLDSGRTLLAWLERGDDGQGHVMGQVLAADFTPEGDSSELSKNAVHDARFDLAARAGSEGLIYHALDGDVRDAVKYRRLDPDGKASQPVLNLVNAPGRARDGAITPFGQGYAVAYRVLPSLGVAEPAIHVAFINQFGEVVHDADLGATTEQGGRTSVAATEDGHVLVSWTTVLPSGAASRALKLYCPGALVLCGGQVQ